MSRYTMCPRCGRRLKKIDEDTYQCPYCSRLDFDELDDIDWDKEDEDD